MSIVDRVIEFLCRPWLIRTYRAERDYLIAEIAALKRRKKRHSHLLVDLQFVTNELLRLGA